MPCYHPLLAWRSPDGSMVFSEHKAPDGRQYELPCGRCIGCRLERSRQWALRCVHEAKSHDQNSFLTLTYREDALPAFGSLHYPDFQLFMKRLRKRVGKFRSIRFYMCGEYGESFNRPHYHCCLFGFDFSGDRVLWKSTRDFKLYRSPLLESLWPHGHSVIGDLTFESAAYTARYVMKKITGEAAEEHYRRIDKETGEVVQLVPEFNKMSLRPGVGGDFIDKYMSDVYPHDYVIHEGRKMKPPRYYDKRFEKFHPDAFDQLKADREVDAKAGASENTAERLAVREIVAKAALNLKRRDAL